MAPSEGSDHDLDLDSEWDVVACPDHDQGYATFICRHLISRNNSNWYSDTPEDEEDWPSAWCGQCHQHFLLEGEWNESSEAAADTENQVQVVCHHCYLELKSSCTVNYI